MSSTSKSENTEKFSPIKYVLKIFFESFLIAAVLIFMQKYFENKWAPVTAGETLRRENFLNAKRDIYFESINLLNKSLANTEFINLNNNNNNKRRYDSAQRNRGGDFPTEIEVNNCFSKLCIYSENKEIPIQFRKFFAPEKVPFEPVPQVANIIRLIRQDLGYGGPLINEDSDEYKYIMTFKEGINIR